MRAIDKNVSADYHIQVFTLCGELFTDVYMFSDMVKNDDIDKDPFAFKNTKNNARLSKEKIPDDVADYIQDAIRKDVVPYYKIWLDAEGQETSTSSTTKHYARHPEDSSYFVGVTQKGNRVLWDMRWLDTYKPEGTEDNVHPTFGRFKISFTDAHKQTQETPDKKEKQKEKEKDIDKESDKMRYERVFLD